MLNHLAFFEAETVHNFGNTLRAEEPHQVVFQRNVKLRRARVALTSGTTSQLTVNAPRLVTLGANDGQTAFFLNAGSQFYVGTTSRHVGGYGHRARLTGFGNDFGLTLVQLGIQHIMLYFLPLQHTAQQLRYLYTCGAHKHGAPLIYKVDYFIDYGVVFFTNGLIHKVFTVVANHGFVGGNYGDVEFVDVPKFAGFGFGSTRHTRQLVVHPEIVLQRDGGIGLRGCFYLHVFLGFYCLMQPFGITTSLEDTSRLLVNNFYFVVHHHVFHITLEESVGLKELIHSVNTLGFYGIVAKQFAFAFGLFLGRQAGVFQLCHYGAHVGQDVKLGVAGHFRYQVETFIRQLNGVLFFFYYKVQLIVDDVHVFHLLGHVEVLCLLQAGFYPGFTQKFDESLAFGQTAVGSEKKFKAFLFFVLVSSGIFKQAFGFRQNAVDELALLLIKRLNVRFQSVKFLRIAFGCGSRNDERCTGIVNQNGVNLIHNGVVMRPLHQFVRLGSHVVAQVIKAEFVVGAVGYVGKIGRATCFAVGLVFVDCVNFKAVKLHQHAHPFRVTLSEIIVDGNHVDTPAGKCVKVNGQRGYQRFTFTGGHLGYLTFMQDNATDELHIVMHHIPFYEVTAGHPFVGILSFVTHDVYVIEFGGQLAVVVSGRNLHNIILFKAAGGNTHYGKSLGKYLVEHHFYLSCDFFLQLVYFVPIFFLFVDIHLGIILDARLHFVDFGLLFLYSFLDNLLKFQGFGTQFIVAQLVDMLFGFLDFT